MTHFPAPARVLLAGLALAFVLLPAALAMAGPPAHQRDFFSDYSGKIQPADAEQIDQALEKASKSSGIHCVLVVVSRMSDHAGMPTNARDFAYTLAKEWKVGNARNGKGMLLLFSLGDKKFHAVKTKNLPVALTDKIAGAMKGEVTLALGDGDVPQAMKKAAEKIAANVPADPAAPVVPSANNSAGPAPPREQFTPVSRAPQGQSRQQLEYDKQTRSSGSWGWVILIVGGIILVIIIISVVSAFSSARGYGGSYGGGYYGGYGPGYGYGGYGGGGDMLTGMMIGGMMNNMFGGGGRSVEHHHHHGSAGTSSGFDGGSSGSAFGSWGGGDSSGGSWGGSSFTSSDGGGFSSFGGGDFSGGSSGGEW